MTRVLVVDDSPQILTTLRLNLRARKYEVEVAADGGQALVRATDWRPDLVVLDLGLPDLDGVEVIRGLRWWTEVPIIVLSGRSGSRDKIRAITRRAPADGTSPTVAVGGRLVDLARKTVTGDDGPVHLTPTEWGILEILLRSPGPSSRSAGCSPKCGARGTSRRRTTCATTWRRCAASSRRTRPGPKHLITEPGMGYRFEP